MDQKNMFRIVNTILVISVLLSSIPVVSAAVLEQSLQSRDATKCVLLSKDSKSRRAIQYCSIMSLIGVHPQIVDADMLESMELDSIGLMIIPADESKNISQNLAAKIVSCLSNGMNLMIEDVPSIGEDIGLQFSARQDNVDTAVDNFHPDVNIRWISSVRVFSYTAADMTVYARSSKKDIPLVSGGQYGQGSYLYLNVPLDTGAGWGYGRFPYLHEAICRQFSLQPVLRRDVLSVYMDWGYHYMENPADLAVCMRKEGISEVHLSSWYDSVGYRDFAPKFINACHANGIRVYAWLELPMVSKEFWDAYPEWREKTALGTDARIDWRSLMALEIPKCMEAVQNKVRNELSMYDWDGVDLAELYFESPGMGYYGPELFTPMSQYIRQDFVRISGVDPIRLFDKDDKYYWQNDTETYQQFAEYRRKLCVRLNREILTMLQECARQRPLDIVLTQIDALTADYMRDNIGVDPDAFTSLQREFGFTLQVEDPYTLWTMGPDRYKKIGTAYREELGPGGKLMLDINIVEISRDAYPTAKQTGLEFLLLLREASLYSDKVCIYSAKTPYCYDFLYAPYAMTSDVQRTQISSEQSSFVAGNAFRYETTASGKLFYLDGREWPCVSGDSVLIPGGIHKLLCVDGTTNNQLMVTDVNGELLDASRTGNGVAINYAGKGNVYICLNRKADKIVLDGTAVAVKSYAESNSCWYVFPEGKHSVLFTAS